MSYILKPLREKVSKVNPSFGKLLECPQCAGFWVGLTIRAFDMWHLELMETLKWSDLYNIVYGFASSFVCYASYLLLKFFMEKYD